MLHSLVVDYVDLAVPQASLPDKEILLPEPLACKYYTHTNHANQVKGEDRYMHTLCMLCASGSSSSGARFKFSVSLRRSVIGFTYSFNLQTKSDTTTGLVVSEQVVKRSTVISVFWNPLHLLVSLLPPRYFDKNCTWTREREEVPLLIPLAVLRWLARDRESIT